MNENPSKSSAAGGGSRPEITTRLSLAPAAGEFTLVPTPNASQPPTELIENRSAFVPTPKIVYGDVEVGLDADVDTATDNVFTAVDSDIDFRWPRRYAAGRVRDGASRRSSHISSRCLFSASQQHSATLALANKMFDSMKEQLEFERKRGEREIEAERQRAEVRIKYEKQLAAMQSRIDMLENSHSSHSPPHSPVTVTNATFSAGTGMTDVKGSPVTDVHSDNANAGVHTVNQPTLNVTNDVTTAASAVNVQGKLETTQPITLGKEVTSPGNPVVVV